MNASHKRCHTKCLIIFSRSFYGIIVLLVLVATVQDFFARRPEGQGEEADEKAKAKEEEAKDESKGANGSKKSGDYSFSFLRMERKGGHWICCWCLGFEFNLISTQ